MSKTKLTVRVGPFNVFFTNTNRQMGLAGHSHYATVDLFYRAAPGDRVTSFPSFEETHLAVRDRLKDFFARPFKDHTNEDIARLLFEHMHGWTCEVIESWGGSYELTRSDLTVRGVPDAIGHADGMTTYTVEAE